MTEVFQVLVGNWVFWVVPNDSPEAPVMIVQSQQAKDMLRRTQECQFSKPLTLAEFLTLAAQHPVLSAVPSWDPLWEAVERQKTRKDAGKV